MNSVLWKLTFYQYDLLPQKLIDSQKTPQVFFLRLSQGVYIKTYNANFGCVFTFKVK